MEITLNFGRKLPLCEACQDFIHTKKAERLSKTTIRSYVNILAQFMDYVGKEKAFDKISVSDIREYLGFRDDVSAKTLYNYHTALSSLWSWGVSDGHVKENIVRKINPPKYRKHRIIPYSHREVSRIFQAARRSRDKAIVLVLIDCGLRASELVNLTVADWHPNSLKVLGKGNKERLVPLSDKTEKAVSIQLKARQIDEKGIQGGDALFCNVTNNSGITYSTLENLMIRLGHASGVNDVHCHRFRHTFAINYLRNGGDIYTLQKILGHSTLEMVRNYLDIVRADITAAHAKASPVVNWGLG